jgi:transposase
LELRARWQALWLLRRGKSRAEVVDFLGINPRTLRDWIAWYRQGGCDGVAQHREGGRRGRSSWLTAEQLGQIRERAAQGELRTIGEAGEWVKQEFGVAYTYWGIRSVLDRLQIHQRQPRPLAAEADLTVQEAWEKGGCGRP